MATARVITEVVVEPVVASKDLEVQDPGSSDPLFKRQIIAGQPVPPDLVEAYEAATGGSKGKAQAAPVTDKAVRGPSVSK